MDNDAWVELLRTEGCVLWHKDGPWNLSSRGVYPALTAEYPDLIRWDGTEATRKATIFVDPSTRKGTYPRYWMVLPWVERAVKQGMVVI